MSSLPKRKKRLAVDNGIASFQWEDIIKKEEIGRGAFGKVVRARLTQKNHEPVDIVLKEPLDISLIAREFEKESRLLNEISKFNNENIVKFFGVCVSPDAIIQELCRFSFHYFPGDNVETYSLSAFLHHIDKEYHVKDFYHVPKYIVTDILSGLSFLHDKDIVHRDLKPSNILVTNYPPHVTAEEFEKIWKDKSKPVLAKLTDFGESWSSMIQTMTMLQSKVHNLSRGTLYFMSPELVVPSLKLNEASLINLKIADLWAFGIVIWVILNPCESYPFREKMETILKKRAFKTKQEIFIELLSQKTLFCYSKKYVELYSSEWKNLVLLQQQLNNYDMSLRLSNCSAAREFLKQNETTVKVEKCYLDCNQGTALENSDKMVAKLFSENNTSITDVDLNNYLDNDASNSCVFLCLKIIEQLSNLQEDDKIFKKIVDIANKTILSFPVQLNQFRNIEKHYSVLESYGLLRENFLIEAVMSFTEEILSIRGENELLGASLKLLQKDSFAIYTCEPFAFLIGSVRSKNSLFLLDTHPVPEKAGGNGQGMLIRFHGSQDEIVAKTFIGWLQQRLSSSGIRGRPQSFAIVTIEENRTSEFSNINHPLASTYQCEQGSCDLENVISDEENCRNTSNLELNCPRKEVIEISDSPDSSEDVVDIVKKESIEKIPLGFEERIPSADGSPYKGDSFIPVFSWQKERFDVKEIAMILSHDYPENVMCVAPPINISNNVTFLINTAMIGEIDDIKCDDMGSWINNGRKMSSILLPHSEYSFNIHRSYFRNKNSPDLAKVISTLTDNAGEVAKKVLVQYWFDNKEHDVEVTKRHGNSRKASIPYRRLLSSTKTSMKNSTNSQTTPKAVLTKIYKEAGGVLNFRSLGQLPRTPQDIYNARRKAKETEFTNSIGGSFNSDKLWVVLHKGRELEEQSGSKFVREARITPDFMSVLATNDQLVELELFCCDPSKFCVLEVDPTFNIFSKNLALTVTTYRNLKLINRKTGKPPVFIGPLLLHQNKSWKTYSNFAHILITEKPELLGVLAIGTDGEKALIDGLKRNFRFSIMLRCFIHVKKNLEAELLKRGIIGKDKTKIINDIFGFQQGTTKFNGLVDSTTENEFNAKLECLKSQWRSLESRQSSVTFFDWFKLYHASVFKESMLSNVRKEAGLGDPPSDYTNNDVESANYMIKQFMQFQKEDPGSFIEEIHKLISSQYENEDLAVIDRGPYKLAEAFSEYKIEAQDEDKFANMEKKKKESAIRKFRLATMSSVVKNELSSLIVDEAEIDPIMAAFSKIQDLPIPILRSMVLKAQHLNSSPDLVVKSPGTTENSFIVAGVSNQILRVSAGKGNSFICDRKCYNYRFKICEHTIAVAMKLNQLDSFIAWFKRTKKATFSDITFAGGKPSVGLKKNKRISKTKKKSKITERIDFLPSSSSHDNIASSFVVTDSPCNPVTTMQTNLGRVVVTSQNTPQLSDNLMFQHASLMFSNQHEGGNRINRTNYGLITSEVPGISYPKAQTADVYTYLQPVNNSGYQVNSGPFLINQFQNNQFTQAANVHQNQQFLSESLVCNDNPNLCNVDGVSNSLINPPIQLINPNQISPQQPLPTQPQSPQFHNHENHASPSCLATNANSSPMAGKTPPKFVVLKGFSVKFVRGTRVRRCYGCRGDIVNPPVTPYEEVCIVKRDIRHFTHPVTGLPAQSEGPQNNHFHPLTSCVTLRYPSFNGAQELIIPPEIRSSLTLETAMFLKAEFKVAL